MSSFNIAECRTWEELVAGLQYLSGWIFRGHASANWVLQSSLERKAPEGMSRRAYESELARQFRRRAHNYLGSHEVPTTDGEWLALMQHYGAPTRLVDFTSSPYVAAYFAFEDPPCDKSEQCAVIAIDPHWCMTQTGRLLRSESYPFGVSSKELEDLVSRFVKTDPNAKSIAQELAIGILLTELIEARALSNGRPCVLKFEPQRLSERMSAQQGIFLWPGSVDVSFIDNLDALGDHTNGVKVFVAPARLRGRALDELRLMNITRTPLFPGLEGYAQSFRQFGVGEPPNERALRLAIRGSSSLMGFLQASAHPTQMPSHVEPIMPDTVARESTLATPDKGMDSEQVNDGLSRSKGPT